MHTEQRYADISYALLRAPLGEWVAIQGVWWFVAFEQQTGTGDTVKLHRGFYDASGARFQLWARVTSDWTMLYAITFEKIPS